MPSSSRIQIELFRRRKFVEARLGFYEQRLEIGVGSPNLHGGTHQSADGQERGRFQRRCVLSELNCKVDQRDADQHCSDDLTDRSNRFPVHLRAPIVRLARASSATAPAGASGGEFRQGWQNSPLFEITRVLVLFSHVASRIENAKQNIM